MTCVTGLRLARVPLLRCPGYRWRSARRWPRLRSLFPRPRTQTATVARSVPNKRDVLREPSTRRFHVSGRTVPSIASTPPSRKLTVIVHQPVPQIHCRDCLNQLRPLCSLNARTCPATNRCPSPDQSPSIRLKPWPPSAGRIVLIVLTLAARTPDGGEAARRRRVRRCLALRSRC
jgi:hypothetical protein